MMEGEMELEEGEAYPYHNDNENNVHDYIDPDVAFSYMDARIRDALGQFQKDFEGGVSAENLGPKFGGYGSFLPACPRSPVQPQSRCLLAPSPIEGAHRNGVVALAVPESQGHRPVQSSGAVTSQRKERSFDSSKQEKCMPPLQNVEDENSHESVNRNPSSSIHDQKMLKFRIKLGSSENMSIQKNSAIYSGLGLDASPSSSLDESPSESEGMSCGPIVTGLLSPTKIIQMMTSCPLNGDHLLSPLSEDLVHFGEKKLPLEEKKGEKFLDKKMVKLKEKKDVNMDLKGSNRKKSRKKELNVHSLSCGGRGQSISHSQKEDWNNPAGKVTEDERATLESKANSLAIREKNTLCTEGTSSRGNKKLKASQKEEIQPLKESLCGSSCKKRIKEDISRTMSENGELKSTKVLGKGKDIYKDFFGEIEQEVENPVGTLEPDSVNLKASSSAESDTKLKERVGDKLATKVSPPEVPLIVSPPASMAPVLIKENWVCCDKCEKWRLLPVGKDPKNLPKKWLCSMLDWLPGKNRCSVSEEETNTFLPQAYPLAPTSHTTADKPDESQVNCIPDVGGKKKHSMKQANYPNVTGGPTNYEYANKSKQRSYECHTDEDANALRVSKKFGNGHVLPVDKVWGSSGWNESRKLGKKDILNDQTCISKPAYDDPMKKQSESIEKGCHNSMKSVLKKRNRDRGSGVPHTDNDDHFKGKKARVSKNDQKESGEKYGSNGTIKSTRNGDDDMPPSAGPTSISYKTNKYNGSIPKVKESPAESVSSSPTRSSKSEMPASVVKNIIVGKKDRSRGSKYEVETNKREASVGDVQPLNGERTGIEDHKYSIKNNFLAKTSGNVEKSLKRGFSSRVDETVDEFQSKKSKVLPLSGEILKETDHISEKSASGPSKVNKAPKPSEVVIPANGARHPSDKRDSFAQGAANAIKEAKDLKHMADRVKESGSNLEGTGLYFEAALKFLHGAFLLESSFSTSSKYSEMIQSVQTYSSTAKLFEYCAHEYEKSKDMASAALAYKCMEVAFMKVVYSVQNGVNRDRQELRASLKLIPPGESPSSSASDVDQVHNIAAVDAKSSLPKDETRTRVVGNHIITARNRPNLERLLNFTQDVNNAMEASRRTMAAFSAASSKCGDAQWEEVLSSVKRAIDFHFQDIEGLLQLVRIATQAIIQ
ncbi:hypothetical protein SAY86_014685 [Trapa natans]|uniref:CW-type domain-containing protein n=1 Tax=Trapa natans TaxID=22666 RepID=A0AAN7KKT5_TRANT|nr:hypothetical protein SAY86_014685 [Trapa natans]